MQQQTQQHDTGAVALRYGLIWGGIFTGLQIIAMLINDFDGHDYATTIAGVLNFLLSLALFFVVGMLASRQTGQVNRGSMAGYFAAISGGVISLIAQLIIIQFALDSFRQRAQQAADLFNFGYQYSNEAVFAGVIANCVIGLFFAIGLGAGMGALGGLLGRKLAKVPAAASYTAPQPPPSRTQ
jgi:hypothetical protein